MYVEIINFTPDKIPAVKQFTDKYIGDNYYTEQDLLEVYNKSIKGNINSSFLLIEGGEIKGIRLAYMPGKWNDVKGTNGLTPEKWEGLSIDDLGYFQSIFLAEEFVGKGWAQTLARLSISAIKRGGGKGILTHSWLESPNNSSLKYLERVGFKLVNSHPNYWINVNYQCPRCGNPCYCTAGEMLLVFEDAP